MKRILYPILFLLAVACAKEGETARTTETTVVDTSSSYVWLPTGVYTYWDYTADTTTDYGRFDSLYYNSDLQIVKVVSKIYIYSKPYTTVNQFVYNADGSIDSMKVTSDYDNGFSVNYLFFYDSNGRLDSLAGTYPDGDYTQLYWTFYYDASGHIQHVHHDNSYNAYPADAYYHRNANEELDSVVQDLSKDSDPIGHMVIRPVGAALLDASGIDKAYLFMMALQISYGNFVNASVNPYWHQYINPDISLFRSGTWGWIGTYGMPVVPVLDYNCSEILNVDGTIRWLMVSKDYTTGTMYERKDKFIYNRVLNTKAVYN